MPVHEMLAHFVISLNGSNASQEFYADLAEVVVETNWHLPGMFTIRLHDRELSWVDSDQLAVGTEVEISAQEEEGSSATTLMSGEITAVEPEFTQGMPILQVRGFDRAHRLHRGRRRRAFVQVTDGDIARTIASEAGLQADVGSASQTYDYVYQTNVTNWEFLQERARRIGFGCHVEGQTLHFKEPEASGDSVDLEFGTDLLKFFPRLSSNAQAREVIVRGWDPMTKQEIIGRATDGQAQPDIGANERAGSAAESAFSPSPDASMVIVDQPIHSQDEADAMAQATADEMSGDYVKADGEARGKPQLRAGSRVNITRVGERFGGRYVVTRAVHTYIREETYLTRFSITGRRPASVGALLSGNRGRHHSRQPGVVVGVVSDNNDPDGMGRVRVAFPWMADDAVSHWARMATPMAGPERGFYYLPEVNDEVLVAFEHDDINHPYVIGALWNGRDSPPTGDGQVIGSNGKVNQRIIKSRSGHVIILDDTDGSEKTIIRDKTGQNEIVIDSAQNSMSFKVDGDFTVEARGKITLKSTQDMTFESQANAQFKATGNLNTEAQGNSTFKGTQLSIEGTAKSELKAPMVSVNGSAQTEVKGGAMVQVQGGVVKIN